MLPGGFPECHTEALSANVVLRAQIAALAHRGAPVHAECGGLMYLCRSVDGAPMCGVLDAEATMTGHLVLGYRDAVALRDSVLHPAGARVSGHEFHRTTVTPRAGSSPGRGRARSPRGSSTARYTHRSCIPTPSRIQQRWHALWQAA